MATKRKRTVITVTQKLEVLERLERGEKVSKLATEFGIRDQTVRDIKKYRDKLMSWDNCSVGPSDRKMLRRSTFVELEEALCSWLERKRTEGSTVTRAMIIDQAMELNKIVGTNGMFTASRGWYERFKRRHERLIIGTKFSAFSQSGESKRSIVDESWLEEMQFQHIQLIPENMSFVYCTVCCRAIDVSNLGKKSLSCHIAGKKHQERLAARESNSTICTSDHGTENSEAKSQLVDDPDDPQALPIVVSTESPCEAQHFNSREVTIPAANTEEVEGAVPVQFEVINIPSSDQWRDLPVDINTLEPIATTEKNICRLCIKNEGTVPIFQDDGHLRVLAVQIMAISKIKVSSSDGLPSHICNECVNMVHSCFNFKVQCEASDVTLRATIAPDLVTTQVADVGKSSEIAVVSSQLNETRDKLDTLVTSMKDLQKQYSDSLRATATPIRHVNSGTNSATVDSSSCYNMVDITDDVEDTKNFLEITGHLNFKGFVPQDGGGTRCRDVRREGQRDLGSMMGFSNVACYLVELDSDSECEENRNSVRPVRTGHLK